MKLSEVKTPIKIENENKKVRITFRAAKNKSFKIYLSYRKMLDGEIISEYKSLGLTVSLKRSKREQDVETLQKAMAIRETYENITNVKQMDIFKEPEAKPEPELVNHNFIELMKSLASNYTGNTFLNWVKAIKHVKKHFSNDNIQIESITRNDVLSFISYLKSNLKANSLRRGNESFTPKSKKKAIGFY